MATRLMLVRHGETDWNAAGRLQGQVDIPLNATGRVQAAVVGRELADGGAGWDLVVSSPLARAAESADLIAAELGLRVEARLDGLLERSFGAVEGHVAAGLPEDERRRLLESAEPESDVADRGVAALAELVAGHPGRRIVAVAHGSLIRLVLDRLVGARHPHVHNGQALEVDPALLVGDADLEGAGSR